MYRSEVKVVTLPVDQWLAQYYRPEVFLEACKACPHYGQVWSCPPLPQPTPELTRPFSCIHIIAIKVIYSEQIRAEANTADRANIIRTATYGRVKRALLESLLELEKTIPGSWCVAAGECELCDVCSRSKGLPCRMPERMRYSFSGLGLDLTRIAHKVLDIDLLWQKDGLPEYNVAIAALLERQGKHVEQTFDVKLGKPWKLLREEILGVLQQLGCNIMNEDDFSEKIELLDRSTGDKYYLAFSKDEHSDHQVELENTTGSGRRMAQLSGCLQSRFPELTPSKNN